MLNNAGEKIVIWSKVLLYLGVALSLAAGVFMIWRGVDTPAVHYTLTRGGAVYNTGVIAGNRLIIAGFLVMILGSLSAWLCALVLRAFGDLSADTRAIRRHMEYAPYEMRTAQPMQANPGSAAEAKAEEPAQPKPDPPAPDTEP